MGLTLFVRIRLWGLMIKVMFKIPTDCLLIRPRIIVFGFDLDGHIGTP